MTASCAAGGTVARVRHPAGVSYLRRPDAYSAAGLPTPLEATGFWPDGKGLFLPTLVLANASHCIPVSELRLHVMS